MKNADEYSEVFNFVHPVTAIKSAFNPKTLGGKLGYLGIVVDAGFDTYDNIQSGADGAKIGTDIVVDAAFGAGGIAASAAAGAFAGSIIPGPGTVIGAVAGLGAGILYTWMTESAEVDGKSAKDWAKDGMYEAIADMKS